MDESGREIRLSKLGPLKRNQTAVLHCHVVGGKPTPQVEWYLNGQRLTSPTEPESHNRFIQLASRSSGLHDDQGDATTFLQQSVIVREIRIGPLKRSHQDAQVTCRATNSPISAPRTRTVTLDIQCKLAAFLFLLFTTFVTSWYFNFSLERFELQQKLLFGSQLCLDSICALSASLDMFWKNNVRVVSSFFRNLVILPFSFCKWSSYSLSYRRVASTIYIFT